MKRIGVTIALMGAMLCGCGPSGPIKNPRFDLSKSKPDMTQGLKLSGPPALPGVVVAELANKESEVFFARNGEKGLIVVRAGGKWASGPMRISPKQAVEDNPQLVQIADAPDQPVPVALHAHGGGFVFAWARPVDGGHEIWAAALDASGAPVGDPRKVEGAYDGVSWVTILSSPSQPTSILWETSTGGRAGLHVARLPRSQDAPGKLTAVSTLATRARGWQAATGPAGTALAWVDGEPGTVHIRTLAKDGSPREPVVLSGAKALSDVHVAAMADRFVVGWTDTETSDHQVHLAHVDGTGKVISPAKPAFDPVGGQALVSLLSTQDHQRLLLAWERDVGVAVSPRRIQLALLDRDGRRLADRSVLDFHGSGAAPLLVADGDGFAGLTTAPMVQRAESPSEEPLLGPVYVRFDKKLAPRTAEPIRVADLKHQAVGMEGVPKVVQGLHCDGGMCSLLATGDGKPALMALVSLPVRDSPWIVPARKLPVKQVPYVSRLGTLADVNEPIADVATAQLADGRTIVAWVTHTIGYTEGEASPASATLAFRFVDGGKPGPIHTLSKRAISAGGIDVIALPANARKGVAVIGWAGPANGTQVYASIVDKNGGKARQKTVTKIVRRKKKGAGPNEVYDVDIAHDGHGHYLFTWSDSRDGNPEIYIARVNGQLQKNKKDTRITTTSGASIEPRIVTIGDRVLLTWSDAETDGRADIFIAEMDGKSLAVNGKPERVEKSAAHSRTPRWSGQAGSLALSWIDESDDTTPAAVRLMAVDDRGRGTTAARRIRISSGATITSSWTTCDKESCRGIVGASHGSVLHLATFLGPRESGAPVVAKVATEIGGSSQQDLAMVGPTSDGPVFFIHDRSGGARLRELAVRW